MLKWCWITIRVSTKVEIQNLDLNKLERSASSYLSHKERSQDQDSPVHRSIMDGILPILESLSSGKSQVLFKSSMDSKKLCIAALLCDPPAIGINFPVKPAGEHTKQYDANHPGKGFRAACVGFSETNYPLIVADILANEFGAPGLSYGPTILVKNGISELSATLSRARLGSDTPSVEAHFTQKVFRGGDLEISGAFSQLSDLIRQEMFSAHINEGRSHQNLEFFQIIESLSDGSESGINRTVDAFKLAVEKELSNASSLNVELMVSLLLTTNTPGLDKYRLAAIKAMDDSLELDDYLKGSFMVIDKLKGVGNYMESISKIYLEVGYPELTKGIRGSFDYHALSDLPNIDMSKISPKDIPRQARGAALELGLGL